MAVIDELDLKGRTYTLKECRSLSRTIARTSSRRLDLSACEIDDARGFVLFSEIDLPKTLEEIDLSHNRVGDLTAELLAGKLAGKQKRHLYLTSNRIKMRGALSLLSAGSTVLTSLDLSSNELTDPAAVEIALLLAKRRGAMLNLDLSDNLLGKPGQRALGKLQRIYPDLLLAY